MAEYEGSKTGLVADVDCTVDKPLCQKHGVKSYPTFKWGDPSNLQNYNGGRALAAFRSWASTNLKAPCTPADLDSCEGSAREQIERLMAMPIGELEAKIKEIVVEEETLQSELQDSHATQLKVGKGRMMDLQAAMERAKEKGDKAEEDKIKEEKKAWRQEQGSKFKEMEDKNKARLDSLKEKGKDMMIKVLAAKKNAQKAQKSEL